MVLLRDISEICGVSLSTASKALSEKYSDISEETREKVRKVAKELDFHAKPGNRPYKRHESGVISVLTEYGEDDIRNAFYRQMLWGMLRAASEEGYDILFMPGRASRSDMSCLGRVVRRQPDGVCFLCDDSYMMSAEVRAVLQSDYPVIALESDVHGCSVLRCDERKNAQILMEYLTWCGHDKVAYLGDSSLFSRRGAHYLMEASIGQNTAGFRVISEGEKIEEHCVIFDTVEHARQWIGENAQRVRIPEDLSVAALRGPEWETGNAERMENRGCGDDCVRIGGRVVRIAHIINNPIRLGQEAIESLLRIVRDPMSDLKGPIYVAGFLEEGNSIRFIGG